MSARLIHLDPVGQDLCTRGQVLLIGYPATFSGPLFDQYTVAVFSKLSHAIRDDTHPIFIFFDFFWNSDNHNSPRSHSNFGTFAVGWSVAWPDWAAPENCCRKVTAS